MSKAFSFYSLDEGYSPKWPFYRFLSELVSVYAPIKADLAEAMQAQHDWFDGAEKMNTENLRKAIRANRLQEEVDEQSERIGRGRPKSNLRATGILVSLQALLEDLRQRVVGNVREHFGASINGVPFSQLLQAGANCCRHGNEWWRQASEFWPDWYEITAQERRDRIDAGWSRDQRRSIEIIAKALGVDQEGACNQPAIKVLVLLSGDGDMAILLDRMIATAVEIAKAKGRLEHLQQAARVLGFTPPSA